MVGELIHTPQIEAIDPIISQIDWAARVYNEELLNYPYFSQRRSFEAYIAQNLAVLGYMGYFVGSRGSMVVDNQEIDVKLVRISGLNQKGLQVDVAADDWIKTVPLDDFVESSTPEFSMPKTPPLIDFEAFRGPVTRRKYQVANTYDFICKNCLWARMCLTDDDL
jgi:hypothetical protein